MSGRAEDDGGVPDVRMAGVRYTQLHLTPPFCARAPLDEVWRLYVVRGGDVLLEADDVARTRQYLPSGSVVALSGVLQHRFSSAPAAAETPWIEQPLGTPPAGATVIVIGSIAKNRMAFVALFERIVALPADRHPELVARFARAIDWIIDEAGRPGPIADEIMRRLAEITTLEIGRFERTTRNAASDHRILRAIAAFYAAPQEKWSVERLADVAGMSRTAFAVRYRQLIGTTPLRSVRQLRLQRAAEHLASTSGVAVTAKQVGYGSDTSFIRAFSSAFGDTPGQVRKQSFFEKKDQKTF